MSITNDAKCDASSLVSHLKKINAYVLQIGCIENGGQKAVRQKCALKRSSRNIFIFEKTDHEQATTANENGIAPDFNAIKSFELD